MRGATMRAANEARSFRRVPGARGRRRQFLFTNLVQCVLGVAWATLAHTALGAAECELRSAQHRLGLLELYTSEGCNSCPPADRWLSRIREQYSDRQLVALAFHVDYWNQLGWPDRFSHSRYTQRQQQASERNRAQFIYTPQFLLDGRDVRPVRAGDALTEPLARINQDTASVQISAKAKVTAAREVDISGLVQLKQPAGAVDTYVALYENGIISPVKAGENGGKTLRHDYVVRALVGPLSPRQDQVDLSQRIALPADAKVSALGVAVFAQDRRSGRVLQAVAQEGCLTP